MIPTALTNFIVHILSFWHTAKHIPAVPPSTTANHDLSLLNFELRHQHAVLPNTHVIFSDVPTTYMDGRTSYEVQTRRITTHRPPSFEAHSQARLRSIRRAQSEALQWDEEEIIGPDVESRETLLQLAKMSNNAYLTPDNAGWYDLEGKWFEVRGNPTDFVLHL
jgi:lipase ATG15